jgi:serine/threonine protein kinase
VFENFVHEHFGDSANVEDHYDCSGEVLGKGSFGSVILCTHRQTRDSCALKVIKLREINPYNVHLLHSEIKIMKALDHPNIVKLKEVFFGKREVHIVMELCSGGDLQTHLKTAKNGSLSESDIARLLRTMMSCVLYLHENGIVHR